MAGDSSESPAIVTKRRSLLRDDEGLRVHRLDRGDYRLVRVTPLANEGVVE